MNQKNRTVLFYLLYTVIWSVLIIIMIRQVFPDHWKHLRNRLSQTASPAFDRQSLPDPETWKTNVAARHAQEPEGTIAPPGPPSEENTHPSTLPEMDPRLFKYLEFLHSKLANSRWPIGAHRYHKTIGFEPTPSFSKRMLNNTFHAATHRLGYRISKTESMEDFKPGGVLSMGCSFTYGDMVEADQTFTRWIGDLQNLPSYNYGVCGYSYTSSLLRLTELHELGILKKLQPSILVLGAGAWLEERSVTPFYPTGSLRFGYAYVDKKEGSISIFQPNEFYSLQHMYAILPDYFQNGVREQDFTPERQRLIWSIAPRIHAAERDSQTFTNMRISQNELYTFFIDGVLDILSNYDTQLAVLWMPATRSRKTPPGYNGIQHQYKDVTFVDGRQAVADLSMKELIVSSHPTRLAHRRYGHQVVSELQKAGRIPVTNTSASDR